MFKYRIIGFTILMLILCGIFFWKPWGGLLFIIAAPAMSALAIYECARMLNNSGRKNFPALTGFVFYALSLLWCLHLHGTFDWSGKVFTITALLLPLAGCAFLLDKNSDNPEKILCSFGITALFAPTLLLFLSSFYATNGGAPRGAWLLYLCLATKATDTGGYICGMLTAKLPGGNHKIAPSISPKKSWEGLIGGFLLSLAVGWLFYRYAAYNKLVWYLTASALLSLGCFFGDLAESAVKRLCNIKDSGNWVPGMGGAFDVLDSFIFNGIIFYILLAF